LEKEGASEHGKGAAKAKQEVTPKKAPRTLTNNMPAAPLAKDEESDTSTLDDNKLLEAAAKLIPPDAWGD
jgi:hypothetical protein